MTGDLKENVIEWFTGDDIFAGDMPVMVVKADAYEALAQLPSAQPEPCGDVVSRNAIVQKLNEMDRYVSTELRLCDTDKKFPQNEVFIVDDVYEEIVEQLPSAQPEKRTEERTETHGVCLDAIDRQATIDALEKVAELFPWRVPGNRDSYDHYNEGWNDAIGRAESEIEKLPSAQPEVLACGEGELIAQPEIIRCKGCKHRDPEDHKCDCGHDIIWQLPRDDKWYCADAERRTDGN